MSEHTPSTQSVSSLEPIVEPSSLRGVDGVQYTNEEDVVEREVVDQIADLDNMAGVGILDPDGRLLLRRETETCSWKIPVVTVQPGDDYAAAIRDHVAETIGFDLRLDAVATVLSVHLETESGDASAEREFVTFAGSPRGGDHDLTGASPSGDPVHEADWFAELPEDMDRIPGTERFLD